MKSKAQEWAEAESARLAERMALRDKMLALRSGDDSPRFKLSGQGEETPVGYVDSDGKLQLDQNIGYQLTSDEAIALARWILDTFEAPK